MSARTVLYLNSGIIYRHDLGSFREERTEGLSEAKEDIEKYVEQMSKFKQEVRNAGTKSPNRFLERMI